MKSHTDLPQSRTLSEILPLESADKSFRPYREEGGIPDYEVTLCPYRYASWIGLPCWSLAALLDVLEQVKEIKHQRVTILVGRFAGNQWYVEFVKVQDERSVLLVHSKELVDACVEIILKLHELKLI